MPIQLLNILNFQDILPSLCVFFFHPWRQRAGLRVRIIQKNTIKDNKRHENTKWIIDGAPPWPQHSTQQMGRRPWVASCGPDSRGLCSDVVVVVEEARRREGVRERGREMERRNALYCESLISGSKVGSLSPCGFDRWIRGSGRNSVSLLSITTPGQFEISWTPELSTSYKK